MEFDRFRVSLQRLYQSIRESNRVVLVYTGLICLWLILRLLFFDRFWLLALVNFTAEYYFVPLPILAIVVILRRQRGLLVSLVPLAIPALTFGVMFGGLFLPSFNVPHSAADPITAMTFNLLWENEDYAAIGAAVRAGNPDFVGVEELHPDHYAGIVAQLQADYPYYTPAPADPNGGVGLFSRYPIESSEPFALPPRNLTLHAILNIEGRRVQVFVVHLSANNMAGYPLDQFIPLAKERNESRLSETAQLQKMIAPMTEPVILLCDCNLTDTSQAYQTLSSFLVDSHQEAGWGFAHTISVPGIPFEVQRIDYVWHNAGFVALETQVGVRGGSDHLPFIAKLAFTETK
jgi:vancomycin resistance protein VanJ